jgi:hypothetical protein
MDNTIIRPARTNKDKKAILELIKEGFGKGDLKFAERYYDKFFGEDELSEGSVCNIVCC